MYIGIIILISCVVLSLLLAGFAIFKYKKISKLNNIVVEKTSVIVGNAVEKLKSLGLSDEEALSAIGLTLPTE